MDPALQKPVDQTVYTSTPTAILLLGTFLPFTSNLIEMG
jgi:hypothetical protein